MKPARTPDWTAVEAAWTDGVTITAISQKFRITDKRLHNFVDARGLPVRNRNLSNKRLERRKWHMIQRAHMIINEKVRILEHRLVNTEQGSLEDARDANTLRTLVILFERLLMLEHEIREDGNIETGAIAYDQAERLRADLAKRLAQIHEETD